jgi:hypothetical protein
METALAYYPRPRTIRQLVEEAGGQVAVAEALGITRQAVHQWTVARKAQAPAMSRRTLEGLVSLGVPVGDVLLAVYGEVVLQLFPFKRKGKTKGRKK